VTAVLARREFITLLGGAAARGARAALQTSGAVAPGDFSVAFDTLVIATSSNIVTPIKSIDEDRNARSRTAIGDEQRAGRANQPERRGREHQRQPREALQLNAALGLSSECTMR
jgi:hypothetical protein